ncbi:hypothetical protein ARMSODRAFT_665322 [Armillaria solidipes]|uniref:Uncharacterized protein n=1 Tax=Armillaria solidipes TaxID=1076256 RepID=A0A2H3BEF0_9AGAR|nr:hypothetical protein ARMSODRAFT_665322 [Armillaria solidipes]
MMARGRIVDRGGHDAGMEMVWTSHETASSWGITDNGIIFGGLKNKSAPKMQPVGALVEQGGGNVRGMGMMAAVVGRDIGTVVSSHCRHRLSDLENGDLLKTGLVEVAVQWGGIDVAARGESAAVGQHGTTVVLDC